MSFHQAQTDRFWHVDDETDVDVELDENEVKNPEEDATEAELDDAEPDVDDEDVPLPGVAAELDVNDEEVEGAVSDDETISELDSDGLGATAAEPLVDDPPAGEGLGCDGPSTELVLDVEEAGGL